ncbi:unnamed protein product [Xylocopa violacea]|uniref:Uncharacterized protein n=1 Tax=Xylocopa violacea TaxID=135666 RepID=A0ABP1N2M1_XYLVO
MKFPLWFAASILLTSVRASDWAYHEIVGAGQSPGPLLVAPVYRVAPAVSLLPTEPIKEVGTLVAGPVTRTIVEGSSSGPVTIVSAGTPTTTPEPAPITATRKAIEATAVSEDSVLIKGASAGPVTLVAPSDNPIAIADSAASAEIEAAKGAVAASATAKAGVAIENAKVSSATEATVELSTVEETVGVASANAVIGPSTGPIIIAGPTAPPLPAALTTPTAAPVTVVAPTATGPVSVSSSAVANASVTSSKTTAGRIVVGHGLVAGKARSSDRIFANSFQEPGKGFKRTLFRLSRCNRVGQD